MTPELQKKVNRAIKLIQAAGKIAKEHGQPLEICYSGGKDSDVILELARMADVDYRAIYKNTGIDPKGNIQYCRDNNVEIMKPKAKFLDLIKRKGYPSRQNRYCCQYLKEYKILDYAILGIRREESNARKENYKEPETCRYFGGRKIPKKTAKNAHKFARQYYPLLDWTKDNVLEFVKTKGIKLNPLYYTENGEIDGDVRLGCMCCPLASYKKRLQEFKKYPNMVRLYVRGGGEYLEKHPHSRIASLVRDKYEFFCFDVFCQRSYARFQCKFGATLFSEHTDCKAFLEDYFNIKFKD